MPIDELEILELYVNLFSSKETDICKSEESASVFSLPGDELKTEQITLLHITQNKSDALVNLASDFLVEGHIDLANAATKISHFLIEHGDALEKYLEPEYRMLEYVYPIV